MEHRSPTSGEKHWWTMTSECPMCLREENARLDQRVRNLEGAHTLGTALIERLTRERDELQEHEQQTHERLGAILGTDDSLEECAKRAIRERDEAQAKLARLEEHDVTHAGPCCVRDIRGVDILGKPIRALREQGE